MFSLTVKGAIAKRGNSKVNYVFKHILSWVLNANIKQNIGNVWKIVS